VGGNKNIRRTEMKKDSSNRKPASYICNPPEVQARVGKKVYDRVAKQVDKWEAVEHSHPYKHCPGIEFIGNVRPLWDKAAKRFVFKDYTLGTAEKYEMISGVISSALLLYRLLVLFSAKVEVEPMEDKYKCIWWVVLRHKATGEYLQLGEWKGAAGTWTKYYDHKELPASFKRDTLALMNELTSKDCPHPYDGLVAGSVA